MKPRLPLFVLLASAALPSLAAAQDAGVVDVPAQNPMGVVTAARGDATPVLSDTRRHRRAEPFEHSLRMPLERRRCYEVLGYATGSSPVFAQVMAGRAHVGTPLALTNSVGRVARQTFCAEQPGDLYALTVRAEGEAWWYLAVVPTAAEAPAAPAPSARTAEGHAPTAGEGIRIPTEQHVVGGEEQDYVGRQIQAFARQRPGVTGYTAAVRRQLPTNGVYEAPLVIPSGRCVHVVAVGVPSVADLVVELEDPAGHRVAQDAARRANESVRYCAAYAGTFRMRVRVFSGAGLVGVQALLEP